MKNVLTPDQFVNATWIETVERRRIGEHTLIERKNLPPFSPLTKFMVKRGTFNVKGFAKYGKAVRWMKDNQP